MEARATAHHRRRLRRLSDHVAAQPQAQPQAQPSAVTPPPPAPNPSLPAGAEERDEAMKRHFETFGYFVLRSAFDGAQMARFSAAFDAGFDRMCGPFDERVPGERGASERNQMAYPGLQLDPIFAREFLDDPTVLHISRLFLGEDCILVASDAQRIESWTHWHADTPPEVDYSMMKCIMYLDDHGDGQGSVALLPGSHHFGFASRAVALGRAADEAEEPEPWMRDQLPGAVTACTRPGVRALSLPISLSLSLSLSLNIYTYIYIYC